MFSTTILASLSKRQLHTFAHLPTAMQREVFSLLRSLEFESPDQNADIDFRLVREQYLKLAQLYHPDMQHVESAQKFLVVREAYDRLLELDQQSEGRLLLNTEGQTQKAKEEEDSRSKMQILKFKVQEEARLRAEAKRLSEE